MTDATPNGESTGEHDEAADACICKGEGSLLRKAVSVLETAEDMSERGSGAVEIHGLRIEPTDPYGRTATANALTAVQERLRGAEELLRGIAVGRVADAPMEAARFLAVKVNERDPGWAEQLDQAMQNLESGSVAQVGNMVVTKMADVPPELRDLIVGDSNTFSLSDAKYLGHVDGSGGISLPAKEPREWGPEDEVGSKS